MNATEYKRYHEMYMENNEGSSLLHTFIRIFYTVQCAIKIAIEPQERTIVNQYLYEYVFIVATMTLVHTVASDIIGLLIIIDTMIILYRLSRALNISQVREVFMAANTFRTKRLLSISFVRGLTYIITVFCILAVDFKAFPRFLAKTERYGYSLMDTGVGLFVLMSGLVHRDITNSNCLLFIKENFKLIIILVILGTSRVVSVTQVDYHQHVTEYGTHWNFFFSLAVCKLISTVLLCVFALPLLLSIFTLSLHETLLQLSLQDWAFSNIPRISYIDANREGITSILGYVSMYLFAVHLKCELTNVKVIRWKLLLKLINYSVLLCFFSYFVNIVRPTSRTLANAGYCLYIEAIFLIVMTILYILEVLSQDKKTGLYFNVPLLVNGMNSNGLMYFVGANLLTGLINMSMQTLLEPTLNAILILNSYMLLNFMVTIFYT